MFFLDFNIFDFIDITLVSILIFQLYKLVKGSAAINIFIGMTLVYIMWKIFSALENNQIDYGFIPIENSLGGSLFVNYDLLSYYRIISVNII